MRSARQELSLNEGRKTARILLVDDDRDVAEILKAKFGDEGHTVQSADPRFVLAEMRRFRPDVVILDVLLPGIDGFEVCKQIRRSPDFADVGIIITSARASETDRVVGLEVGADDYVSKPFSVRELQARTRAVLRRRDQKEAIDTVIQWDHLKVDASQHQVQVGGRRIDLSALEFKLLHFLAAQPGRVYSREQLLDRVWGMDRNVTTRNVDVCVRRIREKIEARPESPQYIQTIHGVGYRFGSPDAG